MKRSESAYRIALPRHFASEGNRGVLLIHGIRSYPGVMDYLGTRIFEERYSVSIPRLPGHGTNMPDLLSVRGSDWHRCVIDAYQNLRSKNRRVYVVGLSLGGILACLLAEEFNPDGIVLLAPAILNTNRLILLTPLVRYFIRRIPNTYAAEGQDLADPEIAAIADEYWQWKEPGPFAEVLRLQRRARRRLEAITCPVKIVVSREDHAVPLRVAELITRRVSSSDVDTTILEKSRHTMVSDCEKERVAQEVVSSLNGWDDTVHPGALHEHSQGASSLGSGS